MMRTSPPNHYLGHAFAYPNHHPGTDMTTTITPDAATLARQAWRDALRTEQQAIERNQYAEHVRLREIRIEMDELADELRD